MFRSHTYLSSYSERDILAEHGEFSSATHYGHPSLVEVEHDYDEVTREEVEEIVTCPVQMPLCLQSTIPDEVEHQELGDDEHLFHNDTASTPDSVVGESDNEEEDCFEHISAIDEEEEEGENSYGHVDAFDEFESCTNSKQDLPPEVDLFEEKHASREASICSSVAALPHLNSEDRLNNNSSLDTLLTQSILAKSPHCHPEYNEDSDEPGMLLLL